MAYGTANIDVIQSSTANTPVQFNDGNGTQVGTLCRAWVNFNGSSAAINKSFNVSSVTRTSAGYYTINFSTALPDSNYCAVAPSTTNSANNTLCTSKPFVNSSGVYTAPSTTSFVMWVSTPVTGSGNDAMPMCCVAVFD